MTECIFCKKTDRPKLRFAYGYICAECILDWNKQLESSAQKYPTLKNYLDSYYNNTAQVYQRPKKKKSAVKKFDVAAVSNYLERHVIGQEEAKAALMAAMLNHFKQMNDPEIVKKNVLLIGPSGSGKTYLVKKLVQASNLPYVIADATRMTGIGFVGDNVDSVLYDLYVNAGCDLEKAQHGVVYIDEIDKIGKTEKSEKINSVRVQQELLKLIEGDTRTINVDNSSVVIDTKNILFICGGAFSEAYENRSMDDPDVDLGLIPELMGRLPITVHLDALTAEDLFNILTNTENSLIIQQYRLFRQDNAHVLFTEDAIMCIADKAIMEGTGARGLQTVIDDLLVGPSLLVNILKEDADTDYSVVYIDQRTVRDLKFDPECVYIFRFKKSNPSWPEVIACQKKIPKKKWVHDSSEKGFDMRDYVALYELHEAIDMQSNDKTQRDILYTFGKKVYGKMFDDADNVEFVYKKMD